MGGSFSCVGKFPTPCVPFFTFAFSSARQAGFWEKLSRKAIKRNEKSRRQ
jgi:hypothetical protein